MLNPDRDFKNVVTRYAQPERILSDGIVSYFEFDAASEFKNLLSYSTLKYSETILDFQNHVQSNRILLYGLIANKLKQSSFYINSNDKIYVDTVLNLSSKTLKDVVSVTASSSNKVSCHPI